MSRVKSLAGSLYKLGQGVDKSLSNEFFFQHNKFYYIDFKMDAEYVDERVTAKVAELMQENQQQLKQEMNSLLQKLKDRYIGSLKVCNVRYILSYKQHTIELNTRKAVKYNFFNSVYR